VNVPASSRISTADAPRSARVLQVKGVHTHHDYCHLDRNNSFFLTLTKPAPYGRLPTPLHIEAEMRASGPVVTYRGTCGILRRYAKGQLEVRAQEWVWLVIKKRVVLTPEDHRLHIVHQAPSKWRRSLRCSCNTEHCRNAQVL